MENLVNIGYTKKPHGLKGELKVQIDDLYLDDFLDAETVFLELKGKKLPFFIENVREGNEVLVKFEDVDSKEAADALSGKEIFLRESDIVPLDEKGIEEDNYIQYIGYQIQDSELGLIGEIEDIIEYPQQMMAAVTYQDRAVLIPLNEAFIKEVQKGTKILLMELPEGLLDL